MNEETPEVETDEPVNEPTPTQNLEFDKQAAFDVLLETFAPLKDDTTLTAENTKAILEILEQFQTEREEQKALEELEALELEALELEPEPEPEQVTDYLQLVYDETVKQNELIEQQIALTEETAITLQDSNTIASESSIMLVVAIVVTIGVKVFIDQVTKW